MGGVKEDGKWNVRFVFPPKFLFSIKRKCNNRTDDATVTTLHSLSLQVGRSSKRKTGDPILRLRGCARYWFRQRFVGPPFSFLHFSPCASDLQMKLAYRWLDICQRRMARLAPHTHRGMEEHQNDKEEPVGQVDILSSLCFLLSAGGCILNYSTLLLHFVIRVFV